MYRTIADFLKDWEFESTSTLKILKALTPEALDQRVNPEGRSLSQLAWHITTSLTELLGEAGLAVEGSSHLLPPPEDINAIIEGYEAGSASLVKAVQKNWSDEKLGDPVTMYGMEWTYGTVLTSLITHQAHHRGQMTVLMRQAGLRVPGIYGPAREDWVTMGMEAPAW
jgi:uncharacterized damage-inducible protein DinB